MEQQFLEVQSLTFSSVAKELSSKYPDNSLRLVTPKNNSDLIMDDLRFLKQRDKLAYDAEIKMGLNQYDGNNEHPVRLVVYYRGNPVGFAFGCVSEDQRFLEISWMEKRNDAHEDLDHQFLGIVLNAYTAYAATLSVLDIHVHSLALIAPVPGARKYYEKCGFIYTSRYKETNCEAMYKDISKLSIIT